MVRSAGGCARSGGSGYSHQPIERVAPVRQPHCVNNVFDAARRGAATRSAEGGPHSMLAGRGASATDAFLASLSHELHTPLNAIIGFTGTLLMELPGPLNTEQQRQLTTVQNSGKQLLAVVDDLLELAKIDAGAVQLAVQDVDCAAVIQEVVTRLGPIAAAKGLRLTAGLRAAPVVIQCDEPALRQILTNLVSNAIRFTDDGEVVVTLLAPDVGRAAAIVVRDTGPGIEAAERDRLFEPFHRGRDIASPADSTRSSQLAREGAGLGLYLAQRLAALIGAQLTVESTDGTGSAFLVNFRAGR